ncbi:hypothetical protein [Mycobacteroides abscessus]|uniref:hypothetical protein n=1 Tax=Mycobacteroides abscessus TaxID=36809 RepID=UPI0010424EA6|nr:hypothetical protein [Mycobacteroides abscessus]MBN7441347.1 hypothetical protein [Mycobacteroides abscessus subsp. abscessus]NOS00052.1 hypothetical protein [Mycobacteroides abscessus]
MAFDALEELRIRKSGEEHDTSSYLRCDEQKYRDMDRLGAGFKLVYGVPASAVHDIATIGQYCYVEKHRSDVTQRNL